MADVESDELFRLRIVDRSKVGSKIPISVHQGVARVLSQNAEFGRCLTSNLNPGGVATVMLLQQRAA